MAGLSCTCFFIRYTSQLTLHSFIQIFSHLFHDSLFSVVRFCRMFLEFLSVILGWTYVLLWSISFYPSLLILYKMKSSDGFSLDFLYLNTLGYVCYSTSLILQVYSTLVRQQFHDKFGNYPLLSFIDVVYTVHGFILNTITLSLVYTKPFSRTLSWKVHSFTKFFYLVLFVFTASCLLSGSPTKYLTLAIDLAYFKISISFFKYIPQLYHNFTRKSVVGYPKAQIYLDLAGGTFSLLQLFLDNYIDNDGTFAWSEIFHNEGKFGLALVTFFFDFCFISQFWLYRHDHKQVKLVETFGSV